MRSSGLTMKRPASTSTTIAHNVKKAICHPGGAEGSEGARDSTAMIVIIGTIARSWNSRIEKAFSPKGELIRPELLRPGSTCAVDDSESGRPGASGAERSEEGRVGKEGGGPGRAGGAR